MRLFSMFMMFSFVIFCGILFDFDIYKGFAVAAFILSADMQIVYVINRRRREALIREALLAEIAEGVSDVDKTE